MASNQGEDTVDLRHVRRYSDLRRQPVPRASFPFRVFARGRLVLWNRDRSVGRQKGGVEVVPEEHVVPPFEHEPPRAVRIDPPEYLICNNKLRKWAHRHAYLFW